jgi:glycine/D-amino acid oxidase-like deaminating enzyme
MVGPSRRVVLIGGGITGTLTAVALARSGWDVVLAEGAHIGAGSSSRTAAGIRQQFSTRESVVGMRYAVDFFRRWRELIGGPLSPIHQSGYLFLYDSDAAWQAALDRAERQRAWGLTEVETLASPTLQARFPYVSESMVGATFCPTDGFLRPDAVYNDAADCARRLGAKILQQAPLLSARSAGGRLRSVTTTKGELEADLFIDCTNAWTRRTARILGGVDLPVAALKRYLWFAERGEALPAETLMQMPLVVAPGGAYCRPEHGDSLLMGWKHDAPDVALTFDYADQDTIEDAHDHRSGAESRAVMAWMQLAEAMPPLGELAGLSATTAGFYGSTPDHNPFLDFDPQVPNLLRLVGFSGHGAMFGPFTAAVAAALAEAGRSLDALDLPTGRAELAAFQIGRPMHHGEAMVI